MPRAKIPYLSLALITLLYLGNTSHLAPSLKGKPLFMLHRGVHQTYSREALDKQSCTATRIDLPTHSFLENTIPSIKESFALGMNGVEIDVQPTPDGEFVVFHDWTLDCRTDGTGITRKTPSSELLKLDIGYGYTADGGKSYPFRGKFKGAMPLLSDVLTTFPNQRFFINIKSKDTNEADLLLAYLSKHQIAISDRLVFYGHQSPINRLRELHEPTRVFSKQSAIKCDIQYLLLGWSGYVPKACRNQAMIIPVNLRHLFWGWPRRLSARMERTNTQIIVTGSATRNGIPGITQKNQMDKIPPDLPATIWLEKYPLD